MNAQVQQDVDFRIHDKNHHIKKTLVACFMKERLISKDDYLNTTSFIFKNASGATQYNVRWDDSVFPDICELAKGEKMRCVISFQQHTFGNFAVVKKASM